LKTTLTRLGVATIAAAAIALAGCESTGGGTNSPATAKDALIASAQAMKTNSYDFTTNDSTGSVDPAKHLMQLTSTDPETPGNLVVTNDTLYLKLDLGADTNQQAGIDPTKYMMISRSLIPGNNQLNMFSTTDGDAFHIGEFLSQGLVDATRTGNDFTGHVDVTKLTGVYKVDASTLTAVADKAKALPITASVDDQGRLVALKVDDSSIKDAIAADQLGTDVGVDLKISNYGAGKAITEPAASETMQPPAGLLQFLLGGGS
jgi:hypothetical protein